ncbi:hypothetical protein GCM10023205_04200 [Yinghuangia aomiensis]|uniref:Uncharacterized protein n=1 Tax=Yinghuangia aomiensis TaxID=676205 RepID=A0ABP9GM22_9ACTN
MDGVQEHPDRVVLVAGVKVFGDRPSLAVGVAGKGVGALDPVSVAGGADVRVDREGLGVVAT